MVVWDLWLTITTLVLGLHPRSKSYHAIFASPQNLGEGDSEK